MLIEPFVIRPYNKHYEGSYDPSHIEWRHVSAIDKAANIERLVGGRSIGRVLEVGCGTGAVLAELAARRVGEEHVGIDIADPREHLHPGAESLDLRRYDGDVLPFDAGSFDLVVATHVIEHVPNPRALLAEMGRVCRSYVYVEVPCEQRWHASRPKIQTALDIGHINVFSPESFLILIQTSGLRLIELELFDHSRAVHQFNTSRARSLVSMTLRRAMLRLHPLAASRLFCYHCGALAEPASADGGG